MTGQVTQNPLEFANMQIKVPCEVHQMSHEDVEGLIPITVPVNETMQAAGCWAYLKAEFVESLEEKANCKFDAYYNCHSAGKSSEHHVLGDCDSLTFTPGCALYFLAGHSARSVLQVLSAYAEYKLQHGEQSSACFILPKRTAEWNARVVHMKHISTLSVSEVQNSALDAAAMNAFAEQQSQKQISCNTEHARLIMSQHRKWEIRHDSASQNSDLLTSKWAATVAGLPCSLLLDTGAQENFVSEAFVRDNQLSFSHLSAGSIQLGNGSVAKITGKVTLSLSIRNYHTKISMYVTQLSEGIHVVLGEPFFRTASAHIEYAPEGMAALHVWKGTRRFNLRPIIQQTSSQEGPLLSAMQCKKAMKKAKRTFLVNVMHVMDTPQQHDANTSTSQRDAEPKDPDKRQRLVSEARLKHLLHKYRGVFKDLPDGLPPDRGIQHTIQLQEPKTPFKHPYRLSPLELAEAKKQIAELLAKGFIQPSQSPFGAPILFVQKKDGTLRMCIDYRALNALTVRNRYPLPNIADLLDRFSGATVFSSLDLASGYHQIRINEEDVPKTAFTTPFGHYEFKVLSFGLTNAPATFQAVMNQMFGHLHNFCVVYLDDILIFSKTPEEHEQHLETILQILEREGLYAKLKKCDFNKPELLYLGHIIGRDGIKVDPAKISCIADWPVPANVHDLRSFLGLANYFRRFVKAYSIMAAPMTKLTGKNAKWEWTEECQQAFDRLKHNLVHSPVLISPDTSQPFEVVTDACCTG